MSSPTVFQVELEGKVRRLELQQGDEAGRYRARLDGEAIDVEAQLLKPGVLSLVIGGHAYRCVLEEGDDEVAVHVGGERFAYGIQDPRSLGARRRLGGQADGPRPIKSPMPGRVVRLLVEKGQQVEAHQGIVVVEAMKMQNELKAAKAGKVVDVRVEVGATVTSGEVLVVIE